MTPQIPRSRVDAGTILAATDAIRGDQELFTRAQAACLIQIAYQSGRSHGLAEDLAETIASWDAHRTPAQTREERVAARLAAMDTAARRRTAAEGRPYRIHPGGPVDWETGRPARRLEVAA